jgi:membrane protease YdiL (CAAX protease family)
MATHASPFPIPVPKPGPGVLISFCWLIGLILAQIAFSVAAVLIIVVISLVLGEQPDLSSIGGSGWQSILMVVAAQIATATVALGAAFVHARHDFVDRLQLRLPKARHWAFGLLAVIPMSILATEAAIVVGKLDGFSLKFLEQSMSGFNTMPLAFMLVLGCVFPGLFEELLFRAVMGRGMTGRYNVWIGVAIASLFFGIAHLIPAHLVSAAIMGVFLHLSYLYSRSFWVPVSIHFVNNAMAFLTSRYEEVFPVPGYTTDLSGDAISHIPIPLLAAGLIAAIALVACWRHFRSSPLGESPTKDFPIDAPQFGAIAESRSLAINSLLLIGVLVTQTILASTLMHSVVRS